MICLKMERELLPARPAKCRLREPGNVSSVNMCQSPARWDHAEKEEYDAMRMQEIDIHDYARQLLDAHGDRAVVEAAQRPPPWNSRAKANRPKLGGRSKRR